MGKEVHFKADVNGRYLTMSSDKRNPHLLTIHESRWLSKGESMAVPPGATVLLVVMQAEYTEERD